MGRKDPRRHCHAGPAGAARGQKAREVDHHASRPAPSATGTSPLPEGAPTAQQVFEEESGIKLDIVVSTNENEQFQKIIQDTTTKAGRV